MTGGYKGVFDIPKPPLFLYQRVFFFQQKKRVVSPKIHILYIDRTGLNLPDPVEDWFSKRKEN